MCAAIVSTPVLYCPSTRSVRGKHLLWTYYDVMYILSCANCVHLLDAENTGVVTQLLPTLASLLAAPVHDAGARLNGKHPAQQTAAAQERDRAAEDALALQLEALHVLLLLLPLPPPQVCGCHPCAE